MSQLRKRSPAYLAVATSLALLACGKPAPPAAAPAAPEVTAPSPAPPAPRPAPGLIESKTVDYGEFDGQPLKGYLVQPSNAANWPGVLLLHDAWGLGDDVIHHADRLAAQGYVVLVPDLLGASDVRTQDRADALAATALAKRPALEHRIDSAYEYLHAQPGIGKIAALGWDFGGSLAVEAAKRLEGKFSALVIYYAPLDPKALATLKTPILALYGAKDSRMPPATLESLTEALTPLGAQAIIRTYPQAGREFADPQAKTYRADDANDAWKWTLDFIGENTQGD